MVMWQQAYRLTDGRLLAGGYYNIRTEPQFNPALHGVAELSTAPPLEHTHYENSETRPPSDAEKIAMASEDLDHAADNSMDVKSVKAAVVTSLWGRLGRQPTQQEIAAEKARYLQVYKML